MPPVHSSSSESDFVPSETEHGTKLLVLNELTSSVPFLLSPPLFSHFPNRIQPKRLSSVWQNDYRLEDYYRDLYSLNQKKIHVWEYSLTT